MKELLWIAGAVAAGWYLKSKSQNPVPGDLVSQAAGTVDQTITQIQNAIAPVTGMPPKDSEVTYQINSGTIIPVSQPTSDQAVGTATYMLNQLINNPTQ